LKDDDRRIYTAQDMSGIAEQILVLVGKIREAKVCIEGSESVYFNVIGDAMEEFLDFPDVATLTERLVEIQNDPDSALDPSIFEERESTYKTDTPEESHILQRLTRNRLRAGERDYSFDDVHFDHLGRPPRAERIIDALREKIREQETLSGGIDLLLENVAAFQELHDAYTEVPKQDLKKELK